jgi:hypothetical protein
LPGGTVFRTSEGFGELTLKLKDGTMKTADLGLASDVVQVCPIAGDRLLVFESVLGGDGPHVTILSQIDGRELDRIGSRDPSVSPDQHWLVYRQFYAPRAPITTEAYMLYNLSTDRHANRAPELESKIPRPGGRQLYPVTTDGFFRRDDEVLEPLHDFASESFYWSADSRFVAFADATDTSKKLVLAEVSDSGLTAYVHSLRAGEICPNTSGLGDTLWPAMLHNVEFIPAQGTRPDVWATFSGIRCNEPLRLHAQDFTRAEVEVHQRIRPAKK